MTPLFSMGYENAKSAFTYIAINQRLTEFFLTFLAIFLFSAQKCYIFAPAIERKLLLYPKLVFTDDTFESRLVSGAGHQ